MKKICKKFICPASGDNEFHIVGPAKLKAFFPWLVETWGRWNELVVAALVLC